MIGNLRELCVVDLIANGKMVGRSIGISFMGDWQGAGARNSPAVSPCAVVAVLIL